MTLLLEYFGEWIIGITILLEYLDLTFSICGCLLFYNSLIFNLVLLYFGKGSLLCLLHLDSNFQLIPPCSLYGTLDFLIMQNLFTKVGLSFMPLLSLT